jgi:RND family efflux transporter MFP subunit
MRKDRDDRIGGGRRPPRLRGRVAQLLGALALLALGMAVGAAWSERRAVRTAPEATASHPTPAQSNASVPASAPPGAPAGDSEPLELSLTVEAMQRAGIVTATVVSDVADTSVTVPATVMPNAYRETKVNSLVGGIVRDVRPELGAHVDRGEALAVVFSQDLAEAQMKYLSMQAMVNADHRKLERTRKLAEIGAASRQEVEEVTAIHQARATEVAAYRQRLLLLGLSISQVSRLQDASHVVSEVTVPAPSDGVVLTRSVNPGQVVAAGQELFVVADLATVWVIGDLYEKDFASVRLGTPATVTILSRPASPLRGRVAYIDPRVDPMTRTAKVRVEIPNRTGDLRLGMFVQATFRSGPGERRTLVPRTAVQSIGNRSIVYVATEEAGRFIERSVKLGVSAGDRVQVLEGIKPGEKIVTEGSFFLRAEAARVRSSG